MSNFKILKTIAILCLPIMAQAQTLHNNGATFFVNSGATVQVNGAVKNETGSSWKNEGSVNVTGDFENNQSMQFTPPAGVTRFEGTTAQAVSGIYSFKTYDVVFNNPNGITLNTDLRVQHSAFFIDGIVTPTGNKVLEFDSPAMMGNTPSDSSHVNGKVLKQGLGSFIYPVGNGIRYQPIAINLSNNSDGMYVRYNTGNASANPYTANGTEATPLVAYNANEFWNCDVPFGGVATGTVTMYWDDYNNTGIGNIADLKVAHLSNSEWLNEGTTATGTIASGSVTSNVLNSWSPFTLGSISMNSSLPVTLISFTGKKEATANVLNWTTSMEQNNAYFHVQRSQDARNFTTIAKVNTKAINGNSSTMLKYELQDENPSTGNNYYKLEQVDLDGNSSYSEVINIYRDANGNIISIYPNPTKGMLYVECLFLTEGEAAIILSDLSGRKIKEVQANTTTGIHTMSFDMSDVSKGMYMLKVSQGNQVISTQRVEKCE